DDADDLDRRRVGRADPEPPADWILSRPETLPGDARDEAERSLLIGVGEHPPAAKWNPHRAEVLRADEPDIRDEWLIGLDRRRRIEMDDVVVSLAGEVAHARHAGCGDYTQT